MRIVALDASSASAWCGLLEASGSTCFCRWWHFNGSRSDWLLRCASAPEVNREAQCAAIESGSDEARGLVALDGDGSAVGWLKLAPRRILGKLLAQGAYRPLRLVSDEPILGIACMLVHPRHRRHGIARRLVEAALLSARGWGAAAVEAYPRGGDHALHDEEAWLGTVRLYASCGFTYAGGEPSYPVMRRDLSQPTTSPADSSRPSRTS